MTKQKALNLLEAGYKLTHRIFRPGEYIYHDGKYIRDEANSIHANFWGERKTQSWGTDWSVYQHKA